MAFLGAVFTAGSMLNSFLPKNPHFADYLIKLTLEKRYKDKIELQKLSDEFELQTHISLINKAY